MKNARKNTKIGSFTSNAKGLIEGKIYGLGLGILPVLFEPTTSKEGKNYYRLIANVAADPYEIGVAFPKEKNGLPYYAVTLDSPVLPSAIHAGLFLDKDNNSCSLLWNRGPQEEKGLKVEASLREKPTRDYTAPRASSNHFDI